ncbi:MAG: hypothetical protein HY287_09620 [Planctomycetes bacterium]|nr:hypothetical protein [Planctomycetota bacterium]MBI3834571.1 hypothetical protein [Planctomycetota bacterium]
MTRRDCPLILLAMFACMHGVRAETPFATCVLDYSPAPGQFVNNDVFNDPDKALGPPTGGGTRQPNNTGVVTLGGFGGSIILGFDHPVKDDPLNPMGLDAIVFGNASFVAGDPQRRWAECATIEISVDENHNGLPDDRWYLIPGSHIMNPSQQFTLATWDDDVNDPAHPPADADWIPPEETGIWTTAAFALPSATFAMIPLQNPGGSPNFDAIWGYADHTPTLLLGDTNADDVVDDPLLTPEKFYTHPDDPFTIGITPGSGGGDAFDIAWAVDEITGEQARITQFNFIRITTAVNFVSPLFGEISAEIDAVAEVARDPFGDFDDDDDIDLADVAAAQNCLGAILDSCAKFDRPPNGEWCSDTFLVVLDRLTGPRSVDE